MALVTTKEMFQRAYEGKYSIGAFNVDNLETFQAVIEAAKDAVGKAKIDTEPNAPPENKSKKPIILFPCAIFWNTVLLMPNNGN